MALAAGASHKCLLFTETPENHGREVARAGIEPATRGFSVLCSAN